MYAQPTAPRSIGGVLDDTVQLYKAAFRACVVPSLVVALISLGYGLFVQPARAPGTVSVAAQLAAMATPRALLAYLIVIIGSALGYLAIAADITSVARGGGNLSPGDLWRTALRRLPAVIGASMLFLIPVALVVVLIVRGHALIAALLVLVLLYVWNRLQLYVVPLVGEARGPVASLKRSWQLVAGHWWRTATTVAVLFIIIGVLSALVTLVLGIVVGATRAQLAGVLIATRILSALYTLLAAPLAVAGLVAVYNDLKLRKEGTDIEARLGSLQPS